MIKNILVPTDGSGQAFKALLQAISVAEACGARISVNEPLKSKFPARNTRTGFFIAKITLKRF
ncbi:MAG: universal stress protein [Selenomonadaceae bacterium]|nr:universal stress protein [Selenomonadaceae bacterium]